MDQSAIIIGALFTLTGLALEPLATLTPIPQRGRYAVGSKAPPLVQ
jgi:hypothetical protein